MEIASRARALPLLALVLMPLLLVAPIAIADRSDSSLEAQLRYYLERVFGLNIPKDAKFYFKLLEPLCNATTDPYARLWVCAKAYRVTMVIDGLRVPLRIEVGPRDKLLGVEFVDYRVLPKLNWSKTYDLPGMVYDEEKCVLNVTRESSVLATLLSIAKRVMNTRGVRGYLGAFAYRLCVHGCLSDVSSYTHDSFTGLCPETEQGISLPLPNGYWIDFSVNIPKDSILHIGLGLKVNITKSLCLEVVYIGLTRLRGNEYVLTSAWWKPYRVVLFRPSAKLVKELAKISLKYVNSSLKRFVPSTINASTCKLTISGERTYFFRELAVNDTSLIVEYPLVYSIVIDCKYNSTTHWVRTIDIFVSPYTKQVLRAYAKPPELRVEKVSSWTPSLITAIAIAAPLAIYLALTRRKSRKTMRVGEARKKPRISILNKQFGCHTSFIDG